MKSYVKPSYSIIQLHVEERIAGSQCSDNDHGGRNGNGRGNNGGRNGHGGGRGGH